MRWDRTTCDADDPRAPSSGAGLTVAPARVADRGSTTAIVVAIGIVAAFGVAIAKPWSAPVIDDARSARVQEAGPPPSEAAPTPAAREPIASPARATVRGLRIGEWSRLAGDADQLADQPIVSNRDLGGSDGDGTCGGSARVTPFDELIAVSAPPGERVSNARLFPIDTIRRRDIAIRIVADRPGPLDGRAIDGLTLIALPSGGIAARQYSLVADTLGPAGRSTRTWTVCVG